MTMMERTINKSILASAVGRAMFCPDCKVVLDVSDAVLVTIPAAGRHPSQGGICCGRCWKKLAPSVAQIPSAEILNGRELSGRKAK